VEIYSYFGGSLFFIGKIFVGVRKLPYFDNQTNLVLKFHRAYGRHFTVIFPAYRASLLATEFPITFWLLFLFSYLKTSL
jgi:hypothetical protein